MKVVTWVCDICGEECIEGTPHVLEITVRTMASKPRELIVCELKKCQESFWKLFGEIGKT
jgi:hypothetical protein